MSEVIPTDQNSVFEVLRALRDRVFDYVTLKRQQAEEILAAVEWQPIESAPQDGSLILIAFGEDWTAMARWRGADFGFPWEFVDRDASGKLFINHSQESAAGPTRWRPLPIWRPAQRAQVSA